MMIDRWGRLFSSEPAIVKIVATVLPLVAAFQLMDGLSGAMSGVLRGAGKPGQCPFSFPFLLDTQKVRGTD
jgi:MATE family multidrug resistance protein